MIHRIIWYVSIVICGYPSVVITLSSVFNGIDQLWTGILYFRDLDINHILSSSLLSAFGHVYQSEKFCNCLLNFMFVLQSKITMVPTAIFCVQSQCPVSVACTGHHLGFNRGFKICLNGKNHIQLGIHAENGFPKVQSVELIAHTV